MAKGKLRIATCQFAENWTPARNAVMIKRYIARARKQRADVVHFHECAMSGYGGPVATEQYDWDSLRQETLGVLAEAARSSIWVVLGTSHPLTGKHKPHNSLYLISPKGRIVDRYDKRFCTGGDLEVYSPGNRFVTFNLNGIKCATLICYDLRFPELYRELYKLGVRVVFQSFHNAHGTGPTIHGKIMRQTLQGHAGVNNMWISAPNSSARFSTWPGVFITPDGKITGQLKQNVAGLMVNTVDTKKDYYDASSPYRQRALKGILHSGTCVKDVRSADTTCL